MKKNSDDYEVKRDYIRQVKEQGCVFCGEEELACLEMHHLNPETKKLNLGQFNRYDLHTLQQEVAKCIVVCANCHKKMHAGKIDTRSII